MKDKILKLEVLDDNHNGKGYSLYNNLPVFIDKAVKGDIVNIKLEKLTKKYAVGKILSFDKKEKREKVLCPYYDKCGGCSLLHISYEKELNKKKEYIERLFKRKVKITSFDRFNYRNKVTLHVKNNKLGFYEEETNKLIEINKCLLLDNSINKIVELAKDFDLSNVKEVTIKSFNNKILIKTIGKINNKDLTSLLKNKNIVSIYQDDLLIYGNKYLDFSIGDKKYLANSNSFFQVNNSCTKALYDKIKEYAEKNNSLLDLYCGSASIGIYLSDNFKSITGVEINKDSYKCALESIKLNNINNYKMILGDSSVISDKFDVVIVDPPRSGLSKKVISNIQNMKAKKLIYVSCNPSTLKRDIDLLDNYELSKIEAFNMFPGTKHVETICLLINKVL